MIIPNTKEELIEKAWIEIRKVPLTIPQDRWDVPVVAESVLLDLDAHENMPFLDRPMYLVRFRKKRTSQGDEWEFESVGR